jgi:hypothetical protein
VQWDLREVLTCIGQRRSCRILVVTVDGGWGRRPTQAPLAGGALIVHQRREGAKLLQIDVVVPVVVSICSENAWTLWIERPELKLRRRLDETMLGPHGR